MTIEQVYYLTNAAVLSDCHNFLKPSILGPPTKALNKDDATLQEMYYALYTLKAIGRGDIFQKEEGLKNLIKILKKDDSPAK